MSFERSAKSCLAALATLGIAGALLVAGCSEPQQGSGLPQQAAEQKGRETADEKAWREASADATTEALAGYIRKFSAGAHVAEARARLLALEERERRDADEQAWADASRAGTVAALRGYIRDFRSGEHVAQARARLAALEEQAHREADDNAWAEASRVGTEEALTAYVRNFSSGAHVAQARARLIPADERARREADEHAWSEAAQAGTAAALADYVQKFSAGAHVAEAQQRLAAIEARTREQDEAFRKAIAAMPTIDIHKSCGSSAKSGTAAQENADGCVRSEHDARDSIARQWAAFTAAEKAQCIDPGVYLPSYVEWLTCLEIERDVRNLMQGPASQRP